MDVLKFLSFVIHFHLCCHMHINQQTWNVDSFNISTPGSLFQFLQHEFITALLEHWLQLQFISVQLWVQRKRGDRGQTPNVMFELKQKKQLPSHLPALDSTSVHRSSCPSSLHHVPFMWTSSVCHLFFIYMSGMPAIGNMASVTHCRILVAGGNSSLK